MCRVSHILNNYIQNILQNHNHLQPVPSFSSYIASSCPFYRHGIARAEHLEIYFIAGFTIHHTVVFGVKQRQWYQVPAEMESMCVPWMWPDDCCNNAAWNQQCNMKPWVIYIYTPTMQHETWNLESYIYTHQRCNMKPTMQHETLIPIYIYIYTHTPTMQHETNNATWIPESYIYIHTHQECNMKPWIIYIYTHQECNMKPWIIYICIYTHQECNMKPWIIYIYIHPPRMQHESLNHMYIHPPTMQHETLKHIYIYIYWYNSRPYDNLLPEQTQAYTCGWESSTWLSTFHEFRLNPGPCYPSLPKLCQLQVKLASQSRNCFQICFLSHGWTS